MVAKGEALAATTARLCLEVERRIPGVLCSVLLVDDSGMLRPLAGPSLPADYSAALDGVLIGPNVGSCGTAAYLLQPVTVTDIAVDPRWADFRHLALPIGLSACWSSPITDGHGKVVGTFAFYFRERRGPGRAERRVVDTCVHLCTIAIERHYRVLERERRASVDDLTGLPNRAAFNATLARLSCEQPGSWALLVADLDNLKVVNDTFGHPSGDCLLQAVAQRIAAVISPDRVYRLGGDEFAILVQSPAALADLEGTAARVLTALRTEVDCGGHLVMPRATIGGATPSAAECAETVHQNADFALYHAKETGRGGFVRYWPGIGTTIMRRLAAIRDVDSALRENRIEAHYQPVFDLATRKMAGVEALCRMRSGEQILPAAAFHEALSDAHVAAEITARMLGFVAADMRHWLDRGIPFQHVGINVSSADVLNARLGDQIVRMFARHAVPLHHVILEVTESVYMGEREAGIREALAVLRAKGLQVALDDFGTGYTSLTHLLTMPVDLLKIDRAFVARLTPGSPSAAIIEGLLAIARRLGIRIVAEGIEREDQAAQLRAFGCPMGQGYLLGRPMPRDGITRLLLPDVPHPCGRAA